MRSDTVSLCVSVFHLPRLFRLTRVCGSVTEKTVSLCPGLPSSPGCGDLCVQWRHTHQAECLECSLHVTIPGVAPRLNLGIFYSTVCVCLPLTCCQRGNSRRPATLPPATSWCATVRLVSWINMLMYKGMSVAQRWDRQFTCVWRRGWTKRAVKGSSSPACKPRAPKPSQPIFHIQFCMKSPKGLSRSWLKLRFLVSKM